MTFLKKNENFLKKTFSGVTPRCFLSYESKEREISRQDFFPPRRFTLFGAKLLLIVKLKALFVTGNEAVTLTRPNIIRDRMVGCVLPVSQPTLFLPHFQNKINSQAK